MSANEILDCLRSESQAMRELLAELKLQQQTLISGNANQLQQQSQSCQLQIQKIEALSQERQRLQTEWAGEAQPDLLALTADQPQLQAKIKICQHMLRSQTQELQRFQSQNQSLIAQAQSVNESSLEALLQLQRQGNPAVYTASGTTPEWSTEPSVYDYNA